MEHPAPCTDLVQTTNQGSCNVDPERSQIGSKIVTLLPVKCKYLTGSKTKLEFNISYLLGYSIATALVQIVLHTQGVEIY